MITLEIKIKKISQIKHYLRLISNLQSTYPDVNFFISIDEVKSEMDDQKELLKTELREYVLNIMRNHDNMQEVAILPQLLKFIFDQTSE